MAGDNRGSSSLFRRDEQLTRWKNSETNKQKVTDRSDRQKVRFSDGCIFLAAGAAGDKEELIRLLNRGADINTVNQDGITALHAACIDNNLEMVEFLVDNNADINRCDMEGWTPLHATASCGYISIAEFLISRGSALSVVNNDGELAIDVVDNDDMAELLQTEMDLKGIDSDASRSREERHMLEDAQTLLNNKLMQDIPHEKTGASALHVAAAKGYINVMRLLLDAGIDINAKDHDGWTVLHAAVHWGQTEALEILCDNMVDMDLSNVVGQTAYDLADDSTKTVMDALKRKQASMKLIHHNKLSSKKRKTSPYRDKSNKKEKESLRGDSDDKRAPSPSVDQTEVQSWRRPSLRIKSLNDRRNSREESIVTRVNVTSLYANHKDDDVILRKDSFSTKEERNCQDILRIQDNNYLINSQTSNINSSLSSSPTKPISSKGPTANGGLPAPPKKPPSIVISHNNEISESDTSPTNSSPVHVVKMTAGSVIKNFFKSFVPPSRDDESETQRKAHAKMVRSTRRSTQGITLEDVKSAEQFIKKKSSSSSNADLVHHQSGSVTDVVTSNLSNNTASNQDSSFSVDSSRTKDKTSESENTDTVHIILPLRKKSTVEDAKKVSAEDKSDDKITTREGTQAAIQRKKKPKRRSTGVVSVALDDIDPDKRKDLIKNSEIEHLLSVGERDSVKSTSLSRSSSAVGAHNGDIDYKKLYEEQLVENDKLTERLRGQEKELRNAKDSIDNHNKTANSKQLVAESERREKRALERKLSEMEEELRQLQKLKAENEKLRAENRALTRVVSKLTNSATAMSNLARK